MLELHLNPQTHLHMRARAGLPPEPPPLEGPQQLFHLIEECAENPQMVQQLMEQYPHLSQRLQKDEYAEQMLELIKEHPQLTEIMLRGHIQNYVENSVLQNLPPVVDYPTYSNPIGCVMIR